MYFPLLVVLMLRLPMLAVLAVLTTWNRLDYCCALLTVRADTTVAEDCQGCSEMLLMLWAFKDWC